MHCKTEYSYGFALFVPLEVRLRNWGDQKPMRKSYEQFNRGWSTTKLLDETKINKILFIAIIYLLVINKMPMDLRKEWERRLISMGLNTNLFLFTI